MELQFGCSLFCKNLFSLTQKFFVGCSGFYKFDVVYIYTYVYYFNFRATLIGVTVISIGATRSIKVTIVLSP